jgi:hypothetical protein|tara:strand:- start:190 stop:378 length:189 start_codon:yes stop_codon:yes gene_type:complete
MRTGIPTRSVDAPVARPESTALEPNACLPANSPVAQDYERTTHDLDAYGFQRRPIFSTRAQD